MVTGTFEGLIVVKDGVGKKGPWKLYNIKVDGKKYGIGFDPVKAAVGDTVQFEAEKSDKGYWEADPKSFKVIGNASRSGAAAGTGANSFGADPRQASIELQVCLKTAGEIAAAAVGAGTITPDQAADYVEKLTASFNNNILNKKEKPKPPARREVPDDDPTNGSDFNTEDDIPY